MTFTKFRQELPAQEWHPGRRPKADDHQSRNDHPRPVCDEPKHPSVSRLQQVLQARLVGFVHAPVKKQKGQRRSQRQRDQ